MTECPTIKFCSSTLPISAQSRKLKERRISAPIFPTTKSITLSTRSIQKVEGTKNQRTYLSDDEINHIIDTFNRRQEVEDFSVLVALDEIAQKNFSFSAGQYFKVKIEYVDLSPEEFQAKMCGFQSDLRKFFDEGHQLEHDILSQLETLTYEN